jgi:hypothetical protein
MSLPLVGSPSGNEKTMRKDNGKKDSGQAGMTDYRRKGMTEKDHG